MKNLTSILHQFEQHYINFVADDYNDPCQRKFGEWASWELLNELKGMKDAIMSSIATDFDCETYFQLRDFYQALSKIDESELERWDEIEWDVQQALCPDSDSIEEAAAKYYAKKYAETYNLVLGEDHLFGAQDYFEKLTGRKFNYQLSSGDLLEMSVAWN